MYLEINIHVHSSAIYSTGGMTIDFIARFLECPVKCHLDNTIYTFNLLQNNPPPINPQQFELYNFFFPLHLLTGTAFRQNCPCHHEFIIS